MAKDKITEYDATANNNTVCGDVNIAENSALPSDMNNFAREIMSHLKEGLGSGTPLYVDQTNNRLGINTSSPATALDVTGTVTAGGLTVDAAIPTLQLNDTDGTNQFGKMRQAGANLLVTSRDNTSNGGFRVAGDNGTSETNRFNIASNGDISFYEDTGTTPKLFWDASTERLGIGTSSPTAPLTVNGINEGIRFTDNNQGVSGWYGDIWKDYNGNAPFVIQSISNGGGGIIALNPDGGNVGIGTSSPATKLDVLGDNLIGTFAGTDTASAYISFKYNTSTLSAFIGNGSSVLSGANNSDFIIRSQGDLVFASNGNNRRATIDSSGNFLATTTTFPYLSPYEGFQIENVTDGARLNIGRSSTSTRTVVGFYNGNGSVGAIATNGSSTSYQTSSDHRLKENVTADWDATTRLKQLNPVRFNFIADADTTVDGFLAHEVQSVVPEAITGTHNEVDNDGNPVYQGIDQSKLVPLLVKTIQELEARIVALETA